MLFTRKLIMNISAVCESFSNWIVYIGLPATGAYHLLCGNPFLNVSASDAKGVETAANVCLAPVQYLLAGKTAKPVLSEDGKRMGYALEQRFDYADPAFWWKTASAYCALPSSLLVGSVLKGFSLLSSVTREKYEKIATSVAKGGSLLTLHDEYYGSIGIEPVRIETAQPADCQRYERRPGDASKLKSEKEALKAMVSLLNEAGLTYWLDCGTCLGAYRYGGNIPWDWDVDIAILQKDSENVRSVLSSLDPEKYAVQDWSSRDKPNTYLKVYVKETRSLIDIYHFAINEETHSISSILSNGDCVFLPESWKIRERRFVMQTPFSYVFPLKKANFDGIEAFVPNETKKYLQQRYGENIDPAKIYSPVTGEYEKDWSHPYWQLPYTR